MKPYRSPVRLLVEILLVIAVAQACVMLALPVIAAGLTAASQMLLSATRLMLLAGPTLHWRCMAVPSRGPATAVGARTQAGTVGSAIAMTAAVQALGLVLTGVCVIWQQRSVTAGAQERFDRGTERVEVRRHFTLPLYGLNGYTATARIRQQLGLMQLPIIAMTANVMASDREACLAAGMNDHVGKPFGLTKLLGVLLRHTGRLPSPAPAPVAPEEPVAGAVPGELLAQAHQRGIEMAAAVALDFDLAAAHCQALKRRFEP